MKVDGYCYDIESNGFYFQADKIWVIWLKDLNDPKKKLEIRPFEDEKAREKFVEWHTQYDNPIVVAHYGLGFDQFMIMRHLGINFTVGPDTCLGLPCRFVDTLYLSQCLNPDLNGHGMEAYGKRFGFEKIDYHAVAKELGIIPKDAKKGDEFMVWHPKMSEYCERDVDVNIKTFWYLWPTFTRRYDFDTQLPDHYRMGQKQWYLMTCQEMTGFKFDKEAAIKLKKRIEEMMEEIRLEVEPQLPERGMNKGEQKQYTMPAKPFKKDGSLSAHMENFIAKHDAEYLGDGVIQIYGKKVAIESGKIVDIKVPMSIGNQNDMKDWFMDCGWKPTLWNFQKDQKGKPIRNDKGELTPTSPKMQENGKLCPNLENMQGEMVQQVVKWLSMRNRLSVVTTWLENPRLEMDGRLSARRTGITPTHRQKHAEIVNLPKASEKVLLGKEMRSLFICEPGFKIAAGDASQLEGRADAHYTYDYDVGERARMLLEGDEHSRNAKIFFPEQTKDFDLDSEDFNKDDPGFKPYRDTSKNGRYALTYGCSEKKLASTLGQPLSMATQLYKGFWDGNPSLKALRDNVDKYWTTTGNKTFLPALDGRILLTRKRSALLNTLFQSCGAVIMDYAGCLLDSYLGGIKWDDNWKPHYIYKGKIVRRIAYVHDEYEFECEEVVVDDVARLIEKALSEAGKRLNVKVPIVGEAQTGYNWAEVH